MCKMRKQGRRNWYVLVFLILLFGCRENKIEETKFLMATVVDIKVYQTDEKAARAAIKKAFDEIERIEGAFSNYKEDSFISKINRGSGMWTEVPDEVISLIRQAVKFSVLTGGAFDITVGPLVNLWGFGVVKKHHIPSDKEISDSVLLVGYKDIEIDGEKSSIRIKKGMLLDIGGIVKGYAVDRAVEVLREAGIKNALVNAGGNIFMLGEKKWAKPFKIGIQHPRREKEIITVLKISDAALSTSGDYQNYFVENGKRHNHIFDPRTGQSACLCWSVTIVAKDATTADILSTGVFVMGPEKGLRLVESLPDVECFIVDAAGKVVRSGGFDKMVVSR